MCTTILVGKLATFDGSTMMARNDDSQAGDFTPKRSIVVMSENQPRHYKSVLSTFEMDLPDDPMRYTCVPNVNMEKGIWAAAGINSDNIAMSATETLTSNPRVMGADPLVDSGIGEEDMVVLVLPYIHSAREGVIRLGAILEQYGTYEMNGIGFQDVDEIWWLETIGGHHWIAKRVPDDQYVIMPNQQGIDTFDFVDAFGKQENHMCSSDMIEFINENHLNVTSSDLSNFKVRPAFGSHSEFDKVYNIPRAWFSHKYLNPSMEWNNPESFELPWSMVPENKITVEDIKYVESSHYQGTKYDPYGRYDVDTYRNKYRSVGINRNSFVVLTQLRPKLPKEIMAIEWIAFACNAFNTFLPFYANVESMPAYIQNTTNDVDSNNFYWANRLIGTLTDAHFSACSPSVELYQIRVQGNVTNMLKQFDKGYKGQDVHTYLENCNQQFSNYVQEQTTSVLTDVLFKAGNEMKNAFSRSDA